MNRGQLTEIQSQEN